VDGSNIYVAWRDYTPGNYEIYFKMSDDGGTTWTAGKRLTNNSGDSGSPAIAVEGSNIYVVWHDNTPGDYDIYFKKSDNRGTTWSTNKNLTNNESDSYCSAIAVNGSNIYVVWHDYTPGDSEIYFKRGNLY
jgi:Neuraminidase (sialidase)